MDVAQLRIALRTVFRQYRRRLAKPVADRERQAVFADALR
jgi:hypothetical protein